MRAPSGVLASAWILLSIAAVAQTAANNAIPPYLNPSLSFEQRVDDLLSRMTLEEKASQLVNRSRAILRLKVPAYDWWNEALHGVARAGVATVFPEPIGLAATFDAPLIQRMGEAIAVEGRAKYRETEKDGSSIIYRGLTFWSPNINIFRDPRWGRGQETYGEDPYLTSQMGMAFVRGMQGDDPKYLRVVATPKHFAVHSGPEPSRHGFNAVVSQRDLQGTYLPAFRATVRDAKADSVMCAYNRVNGEPACASQYLLDEQLRGAWHFGGYVVSDCGAVSDIYEGHHFTKSNEEAAALALKRGTDLECADFIDPISGNSDYVKYLNAVKQGLLTKRDIDVAVRRLLMARFRLGMFDPPERVSYAQIPPSANDTAEHRQLALQTARESIVLLKNNGVLPLTANLGKIAVIGPLADSESVLLGNYHGTPSQATTVLDGIRQQFSKATVTFVPGTDFLNQYPVPTTVLSPDRQHPGGGLKGEYFDAGIPSGTPLLTRTDPVVDFDRNETPMPLIDDKHLSVRWTGELTPQYSGTFSLGVTADDAFRLFIDDKLILHDEAVNSDKAQTLTVPVPLEQGHHYAIRLDYEQHGAGNVAKLVWSPAGATATDAVKIASAADAVIAVVGITSQLEGEEMPVKIPGFRGGDRTSLDLPQPEEDLLKALKVAGKPLIVVLMNGSALAVSWANQNADAIVEAWYPGEEGGRAVAETIAGVNNPAGRLPVTFYQGIDQLPPFDDYSMKQRTYRYFSGEPLYAFGFGLSYFTFEYRNLTVDQHRADKSVVVEAEVVNTSAREGDEVAELYVSHTGTGYPMPIRSLEGLRRIHLQPHQAQKVSFTLSSEQLMVLDENGRPTPYNGELMVDVGGRQPDRESVAEKKVVERSFKVDQN